MSTEALDELTSIAARLLARVGELKAAEAEQPAPKLLTFEQTAEALAVGRTTVQELIDRGDLPVVSVTGRAVRIDARDIEAFVRRKRERR